jgi:uncharacterized membrane protein
LSFVLARIAATRDASVIASAVRLFSNAARDVDRLLLGTARLARRWGWPAPRALTAIALAFAIVCVISGIKSSPGFALLECLGALSIAAMTYRWAPRSLELRASGTTLRFVEISALGVLFVGFSLFIGRLAVLNYQALGTQILDLGLYDNLLWHTTHGDVLGTSLLKGGHHGSAHFDPILVLLSPLYRLRPAADTLLVLQAVWMGSTVLPLYLLGRLKLGSGLAGVIIAAMFVAHPAVHGAALYEFHSLTLVTPLIVWVVYFLERRHYRAYWISLVFALLCREDVALLCCGIGLYAALRGGRDSLRVGWVTILVGLNYFALVKNVFMDSPDLLNTGPNSYGFAYYYADLIPPGTGAALGIVSTLVRHPLFVLRYVLIPAKLEYAMVLLLPLGFLPLIARPARVLLFYGLPFCMLATRPAVYSIGFQYSTVLLPPSFCAAVIGLELALRSRWVIMRGLDPIRLRRACLAFMVVTSGIVSFRFGAFDPNTPFVAGFHPIVHQLDEAAREDYAWVSRSVESIPPNASVAATARLGPFVSNRRDMYAFPTERPAEFFFLDSRDLDPGGESVQALVKRVHLAVMSTRGTMTLYRLANLDPKGAQHSNVE